MGWNGTGCGANSGITWYSFNLPQRINYTGGNYADFAYGPSRERVRHTVVSTSPAVTKTIYYIGPAFEVEVENDVAVRYRSNVYFGDRLVYSQVDKVSTPADLQIGFIHQDHQGSVDKVTWAVGNQPTGVRTYSFDAFGKRRETNWLNDADNSTFGENQWIERGYTGHEYLDNVRMIHMNGRVQDPTWGRMLSPDPLVGNLADPQSLNPYSYVRNNPLALIDPSGYFSACSSVQGIDGWWCGDPFDGVGGPSLLITGINRGVSEAGFVDEGAMNAYVAQVAAFWKNVAKKYAEKNPEDKNTKEERERKKGDKDAESKRHQYRLGAHLGCSAGDAFEAARGEGMSAPGAPYATEGFNSAVNLAYITSPNQIDQFVNPSTMTITNSTLPGHEFYPGDVTIHVTPADGGTSNIEFVGTGNSSMPIFNDAVGIGFFGLVSLALTVGCTDGIGADMMPQ